MRAFALVWTDGGVQHGASGQTGHTDDTTDREAQAGLLIALLRIRQLIGGSIRQGDRRAINQPHGPPAPTLAAEAVTCHVRAGLLRQLSHERQWQTAAGAAVAA